MAGSGRTGIILEEIRRGSPGYSPGERRVADVVLQRPREVFEMSVTQLARASSSSVGTVVRFCQAAGLHGFQDLKLALAREGVPSLNGSNPSPSGATGIETVVSETLLESSRALAEAARNVDAADVQYLVDALLIARRVVFVAVGTSAPLAADIAYRLTTLGLPAMFVPDVHAQHVIARLLEPVDVCFAISHTGTTRETLSAMDAAVQAEAVTLALTSFSDSPLTELVDHCVVAGSIETTYRIESMTSRIVHLAVLDALYTSLASQLSTAQKALDATADVIAEHRL